MTTADNNDGQRCSCEEPMTFSESVVTVLAGAGLVFAAIATLETLVFSALVARHGSPRNARMAIRKSLLKRARETIARIEAEDTAEAIVNSSSGNY